MTLGYYSYEIYNKLNEKYNYPITIIALCALLPFTIINGQVDMWGVGFGKNIFMYTFFSIVLSYLVIKCSSLANQNKYIEFWSINAIGVVGTQKIFKDIITTYIIKDNIVIIFILLMIFEFVYIIIMKKIFPKLV